MPKLKLGLATLAFVALGLSLAVYACFSPSYGYGFACGPNGECPSGFMCLKGGCYADGVLPPDAAVGDITVTAYNTSGVAVANTQIVFHNPDGTVYAVIPTNAAGQVTRQITEGDMVTAALQNASGNPSSLSTYGAVRPGQHLVFGRPTTTDPVVTSVPVQLPMDGATGSANRFRVYLGCVDNSTTSPGTVVTQNLPQSCVSAQNTFSVVALAVDDTQSPERVIAFSTRANVVVENPQPPIVLTTWQSGAAFSRLQVNLRNAPARTCFGFDPTDAGPNDSCAELSLNLFARNISFSRMNRDETTFPIAPGGTASVTVDYPPGVFDRLLYLAAIRYGLTGQDGQGIFFRQFDGAPLPASDAVDLTASLFPRLSNVSINTSNFARPVVRWDSEGPVTTDVIIFSIEWEEPADASPTGPTRRWQITSPGVDSPYTLPALPPEVSRWAPLAGSTFSSPGMLFLDLSVWRSFFDFMDATGGNLFTDNAFPPGTWTGRGAGINFN